MFNFHKKHICQIAGMILDCLFVCASGSRGRAEGRLDDISASPGI